MVSITLHVSEELKNLLDSIPWVNWSEITREEITKKLTDEQRLKKIKKIIAQSQFTEKDADELANKVKQSIKKTLPD